MNQRNYQNGYLRWGQSQIPSLNGLAARSEFSTLVFTLRGANNDSLRYDDNIKRRPQVIKGPAFLFIHIPTLDGIDCSLLGLMRQKIKDIMYGETGMSVEFRPTVLFVFGDSCPTFATGNGKHFIPFIFMDQEVFLIVQNFQEDISRVKSGSKGGGGGGGCRLQQQPSQCADHLEVRIMANKSLQPMGQKDALPGISIAPG